MKLKFGPWRLGRRTGWYWCLLVRWRGLWHAFGR